MLEVFGYLVLYLLVAVVVAYMFRGPWVRTLTFSGGIAGVGQFVMLCLFWPLGVPLLVIITWPPEPGKAVERWMRRGVE